MKRATHLLLFSLVLTLLLNGCSNDNQTTSPEVGTEPIYGEIELPGDMFSTMALYDNSIVYLSMDGISQASICVYDFSGGDITEVHTMEDYQMNPANNTLIGHTLYFNYVTKDMQRKMVAVDVEAGKAETVLTENDISGMVYSVATADSVYSLKHMTHGRSIVEQFTPDDKAFSTFLEADSNTLFHAISAFDSHIFLLQSDGHGYSIAQYNAAGDLVDSFEIPYAQSILENAQAGYFQMMAQSFYLMNFSGESEVFSQDGTSNAAMSGWAIATNTAASMSQYAFFNRFTTEPLTIVDSATGNTKEISPEAPEDYTIRYAFADLNDPTRVLVVFMDAEGENEIATVVSTNGR